MQNPLLPSLLYYLSHNGLILGVAALVRERNDLKRQAHSVCLMLQEFHTHGMESDPLILFIYGSQEPCDFHVVLLSQYIEREGAVFATAPTQDCFLRHGPSKHLLANAPGKGIGRKPSAPTYRRVETRSALRADIPPGPAKYPV